MSTQFTRLKQILATLLLSLIPFALPANVLASSHMDAPLIILDPAANTTDVYASSIRTEITNLWYLRLVSTRTRNLESVRTSTTSTTRFCMRFMSHSVLTSRPDAQH